MLHAPGAAIHASQRRAGDFESNESGSQHAQVSAQQIPPVLGQRPEVFPTQGHLKSILGFAWEYIHSPRSQPMQTPEG
eukprot:COSAG01_NODE_2767_length_7108_cov_96.465402_2_plen_78_part_00